MEKSKMLTKQEFAAIKARLAKATPGPWRWEVYSPGGMQELLNPDRLRVIAGSAWPVSTDEDAEFFANARTDMEKLIATLDHALSLLGDKAKSA